MKRIAALLFLSLGACSMSADTKLAETAVEDFHSMLNAGQFDTIYVGATDELRKASPQDQFVRFLDAVHRKLGEERSAERKTWRVNYQPSGSFVYLEYSAKFDKGDATEAFTYRLDNGKAVLYGYNINSMALVVN